MDDVFGARAFGIFVIFRLLRSPFIYIRVLPLVLVVTAAGVGIAVLVTWSKENTALIDAMPILLGLSMFFPQYAVSQAVDHAHARITAAADIVCQLVDAAYKHASKTDIRKALVARVMSRQSHAIVSSDAALAKYPEIVSLLRRLDAQNVPHATTLLIVDTTLLSFMVALPISLHAILGFYYLIVFIPTLLITLGAYETAWAISSNPFDGRFPHLQGYFISLIDKIDAS